MLREVVVVVVVMNCDRTSGELLVWETRLAYLYAPLRLITASQVSTPEVGWTYPYTGSSLRKSWRTWHPLSHCLDFLEWQGRLSAPRRCVGGIR